MHEISGKRRARERERNSFRPARTVPAKSANLPIVIGSGSVPVGWLFAEAGALALILIFFWGLSSRRGEEGEIENFDIIGFERAREAFVKVARADRTEVIRSREGTPKGENLNLLKVLTMNDDPLTTKPISTKYKEFYKSS